MNKIKRLSIIIVITISIIYSFIISGCDCDGSEMKTYDPVTGHAGRINSDHSVATLDTLDRIPNSAIIAAKENLHIAYGHTSHGSQLTDGMTGLVAFMNGLGSPAGLYAWSDGAASGSLDLDDYFMDGDLGNPDRTTWAERTREYLSRSENSDVNVVMWSWCGQVDASEHDINTYLDLMNRLEIDYPDITFVYMTGHLDGTGEEGNVNQRNNQIRAYCNTNNKTLYDFADIESYDPDNNYYLDDYATDGCDYDNNGAAANWALNWQGSHTENNDWYTCSCAHSVALNCNKKAYAAWWLWARLAGWNGVLE